MALEPVRDAFGDRFVNVGVAEQNMIGVAAGIARSGMRVIAYSIAPFATWRAAEQVKVDVGLNRLPVCIVGNGAGYGYGYMGPTHHAIDDIAVMSAAGFRCAAPAFDHQVGEFLSGWDGPMYLRLGLDESAGLDMERPSVPAGITPVLHGRSGHVIALGSLVSSAVRAFMDRPIETRPTVWQCVELPVVSLPDGLSEFGQGEHVMVVEEHIQSGGLGQQLAYAFLTSGAEPQVASSVRGRLSIRSVRVSEVPPRGVRTGSCEHGISLAGGHAMTGEFEALVDQLQGPILVVGASGFIGANMMLTSARQAPRCGGNDPVRNVMAAGRCPCGATCATGSG